MPKPIPARPYRPALALILGLALVATGLLSGCEKVLEPIRGAYRPVSLHDAYRVRLENAGLADAALGRAWTLHADAALAAPLETRVPHQEVFFADPARPGAHAIRVDLRRGQRLLADVIVREPDDMQVFLDIFEDRTADGLGLRRVTSADSTHGTSWDVTRSGSYVVRVQPELLVEGTYTLSLDVTASLLFPVAGRSFHDVGSRFGDDRDGGRRSHHGLDIFAPRGTPVVAAIDGRVRSTRTGGLGGKQVWLRASSGANLYYAHLDEQWVEEGQLVQPGDTLGTVGNTGNARTTPPHLHFGIYQNGPNDPWPYVFRPRERPQSPSVSLAVLGAWRGAMADAGARTAFRVVGAAGDAYRVLRPDGLPAFVSASQLETLAAPIGALTPDRPVAVKATPSPAAPTLAVLAAGEVHDIVARDGAFDAIALPDGRIGWVPRG